MQLNKDVNIFFKAVGKVNNILDITTVMWKTATGQRGNARHRERQ